MVNILKIGECDKNETLFDTVISKQKDKMNQVAMTLALLHDRRNMLRVHRRYLRDTTDPFYLPEARFVELFRLTKDVAIVLLDELSGHMKAGVRETFIPKGLRMVAALHFYTTGSYLRDVGQDFVCTMSKTMVCRCIKEVTSIINKRLSRKYVRFPRTIQEKTNIRRRFFDATGFPGVIGAIDCTHVKIKKPSNDVEFCYVNRKGYFSKNVQLVCDYDLNVLSCYARFGGSTHDAYIWDNSQLKHMLQTEFEDNNIDTCWLIGDSGYPLQPWLMTPYRNPATVGEESYNYHHIRARNCIERLNGVLKKLFACLSSSRGLLVDPAYAGAIINACVTLHNFRKKHNLPLPDVTVEEDDSQIRSIENISDDGRILQQGTRIRANIVHNYFN